MDSTGLQADKELNWVASLGLQAEKESVLEYFASRCAADPAKAASIIEVALKYSHILLQLKNCR